MAETMTDESNDVIFVEEPGPKTFEHLFSHESRKIEPKPSTTPPLNVSLDEEKDKTQKDNAAKIKNDGNGTTKRADWDMFAEQDIDSNFDVSSDLCPFFCWRIRNKHNKCINYRALVQ